MSHQRDVAQYVCEAVVKVTTMPDATIRVLGYNTGTGAGEEHTVCVTSLYWKEVTIHSQTTRNADID